MKTDNMLRNSLKRRWGSITKPLKLRIILQA
jgi:hypothetical protein